MTPATTTLRAADRLAEAMFLAGARVPTVVSATGLSVQACRSLYQEIFGRPSPSGLGPSSIDWFFGSNTRPHTSLYLHFFEQVHKPGLSRGVQTLNAFTLYHAVAGRDKHAFSLDRCFFLARLAGPHGRTFHWTPCSACRTPHVTQAHEVRGRFLCPSCQKARPKRRTV